MNSTEIAQRLSRIFLEPRDEAEMAVFLEGMLTPQELEEVIVRWRLLERLMQGTTQRDIAHELGISLGKISRGSRLLKYGPPEFRNLAERVMNNIPDDDA